MESLDPVEQQLAQMEGTVSIFQLILLIMIFKF